MSTSIAQNPLMKRCNRGENCVNPLGCELPATTEYFEFHYKTKDNLRGNCRACSNKEKGDWAKAHPPTLDQVEIRRAKYRTYYDQVKNTQEFKADGKRRRKKYYDNHKDKVKADSRLRYAKNPKRSYRYQISANFAQKVKSATYTARKRAEKYKLNADLTIAEWEYALVHFNFCCAYCGSQQGLWNPITADHFIPLADSLCPGTTRRNMLPACRTCNSSKNDQSPVEWVQKRFGRKARRILARINAYFASLT